MKTSNAFNQKENLTEAVLFRERAFRFLCAETHRRETRLFGISVALLILFVVVSTVGLITGQVILGGPATISAVLFWKICRASLETGSESNRVVLEGLKVWPISPEPPLADPRPVNQQSDKGPPNNTGASGSPTRVTDEKAAAPREPKAHRARKTIELNDRFEPVVEAPAPSDFEESSWEANYNRSQWRAY